MAYSLTSATALGLDLVRTPGGAEVARLLVQGLLVEPGDGVPAVGPAPADLAASRDRALGLLARHGAATVVRLDEARPVARRHAPDRPLEQALERLTTSLQRLRRDLGTTSFGSVPDLLDLLRQLPVDPRGTSGGVHVPGLALRPAAEVALGEALADAALAGLLLARDDDPAAPVLARALRHRLTGSGVPGAGGPGSTLAGTPAGDLLARVGAAAAAAPQRLLLPHRPLPEVWARRMHEATWAVELAGRTRLAARAQLELVRVLHGAGTDPDLALGGVWNTCSGAVQAAVVADVLDDDTRTVLGADLEDVLGAA